MDNSSDFHESSRAGLLQWIKEEYRGKRIKISGEDYFTHLLDVAELAALIPLGYEIGLCHDLLEDTDVSAVALLDKLITFGYPKAEAGFITNAVVELTDVFTKEAYPEISKKERNSKEAKRLLNIGTAARTVKYADLIYNINWTVKYEPEKAYQYLTKKRELISELSGGDPHLHAMAMQLIGQKLAAFGKSA